MLNSDVIIDNSQIDLIRYINPAPAALTGYVYEWQHLADLNSSVIYNRTMSQCLQSGCMLFFTFHGTQIAVYGLEPAEVSGISIWSTYSINGQSNVTHTSGARGSERLLFFQSEEMPYGEYTLQINVGHAEDDAGFQLDWIEYNTTSRASASDTVSPPLSSTYTAMSLTSSSTNLSMSSPTVGVAPTLTPSSSSASIPSSSAPFSATASAKSSLSHGTIAGIVLGLALGLLLVLAAAYKWRQRQKMIPQRMDPDEAQGLFSAGLDSVEPSPESRRFGSRETARMSEKQRLLCATSPPTTPPRNNHSSTSASPMRGSGTEGSASSKKEEPAGGEMSPWPLGRSRKRGADEKMRYLLMPGTPERPSGSITQ